jgi:hypothetical protein
MVSMSTTSASYIVNQSDMESLSIGNSFSSVHFFSYKTNDLCYVSNGSYEKS